MVLPKHNPATGVEPCVKPGLSLKRVLLSGCVLFGAAAIVALLVFRPPPRPPFAELQQPIKPTASFRDWVGQFLPISPGWAWAWKVENVVFGARKPVNIYGEVFSFSGAPAAELTHTQLAKPSFSTTNGLLVWILSGSQLTTFREQLKDKPAINRISRPRISTADGIAARLFTGQTLAVGGATNQVGLSFDCYARTRAAATDLTVAVAYSEPLTNQVASAADLTPLVSIQTNLNLAFRVQLPKGNGLLLLTAETQHSDAHGMGLVIEPP